MKKLSLVLLMMALIVPLALAQAANGRLVGIVQGPDGVIAGATLVITDNKTNKEKTATSNAAGVFSVSNLEVGTYTVKVTASGFNTYVATNLKIDVGQEYTLNPKLEVGAVSAEVTVSAGADVINSANAELSNIVSQEQIATLPVNGRTVQSLVQLQAGVTASGAINGQRMSSTNITRDGLNVQDNFIRTGQFVPDQPRIDDVAEFSVVTQNSGASLGSGGSSQVQFVTPRGGTSYHGTLFEYNQNSKFGSGTFFNNKNGVDKPFLNQNQFGGNISGKLPFPRFGQGGSSLIRDKAFFFFDYEGFRLPQSQSTLRTVLTPSARQGIFTYVDDNGVVRQDSVLTTGGRTLAISPVISNRVLSVLPTNGNTNEVGDGVNTVGYRFNQRADTTRDATTTRLDYDFNGNNSINFVWTRRWENLLRPDADSGGYNSNPFTTQTATTNLYVGAYKWTGGRWSNEVRGGFQGSNPFFNSAGLPSDYFLVSPTLFDGTPVVGDPSSGFVDNSFRAQGRNTKYYNIQDNAEVRFNQHALRFGYGLNAYRISSFGAATIPTYDLDNSFSPANVFTGQAGEFSGPLTDQSQLATANALQSLLAGIVGAGRNTFNVTSKTSGYVAGAPQINNFNYNNHSFYVSDQWNFRPNLTFTLGLRYEVFTGLTDPAGLRLEPVIPQGTDPVAAVLNPQGTYDFVGVNSGKEGQFFKTDKNNFSPILSVAYTPKFAKGFAGKLVGDGKTVLRAGYRMGYINDEYLRASDNALQNAGLTQTVNLVQLDSSLAGVPTVATPVFPTFPISYARNNALAGRFGTVFGIDPDLQLGRVHEYNFSIQRELGPQTAIEFRYVGAQSKQLVRTIDYNQIDIRNNGFVADFIRAQQNLALSSAVNPTAPSAAYDPAIPGSQPLTVFSNLRNGGNLATAPVIARLNAGVPADLALFYVQGGNSGSVQFLANPNTGVANLLRSIGKFNYNSFQAEIRRRFTRGLFFQANYTFQKTLTDVSPGNPGLGGDDQTRVGAFLDNRNTRLDYGRADFDNTHIFNFNGSYDLPFGNGKTFLNRGKALDRLVGGWTVSSVIRINTGFPLTFVDPRGTLNRAGRSGRQTPQTSLSQSQIKNLIGVRQFEGETYYIDPSVIDGGVFSLNGPGQTGSLQRAFVNGPTFTQVDLSTSKIIRIREGMAFQLRAEVFNLFNQTNFRAWDGGNNVADQTFGNIFNITSSRFGKLVDSYNINGLNRVLQLSGRFTF